MQGRGEQHRSAIGRHHAGGMGIEREDRGLPSARGGQRDHLPQDAPVAEMYAVEIADGEGARAEIGGHFVETAIDAHGAYPTTISRPS